MIKIKCDFDFRCQKKWEELAENTSDNSKNIAGENYSVRYCDSCKKDVYKVENEKQLEIAKIHNLCVNIYEKTKFESFLESGNRPRNKIPGIRVIKFKNLKI
jgi:hypothetical protein